MSSPEVWEVGRRGKETARVRSDDGTITVIPICSPNSAPPAVDVEGRNFRVGEGQLFMRFPDYSESGDTQSSTSRRSDLLPVSDIMRTMVAPEGSK